MAFVFRGFSLLLCIGFAACAGIARPPLSRWQLAAYERDGVIVVRGLLSVEEAARAVEAATAINGAAGTMRSAHYTGLAFSSLRGSDTLRHAALRSRAPAIVAQLVAHEAARRRAGRGARPVEGAAPAEPPAPGDDEVRVLKDAFLSYEPGKLGCGWHRDDSYFWPCPENEGPGVNVWVALSQYDPALGGGLAVSRGSHRAPWRDAAVAAIRGRTCDLATLSPALNRAAEARRAEFRLRPGDAIIHDRHCFHRAVPFTRAGLRTYDGKPLLRYSVRYMPGGATLDSASFDPAAAKDGGKTLRSLGWRYPRCWPSVAPAEEARLQREAADAARSLSGAPVAA